MLAVPLLTRSLQPANEDHYRMSLGRQLAGADLVTPADQTPAQSVSVVLHSAASQVSLVGQGYLGTAVILCFAARWHG
jgi:hypothetical protein